MRLLVLDSNAYSDIKRNASGQMAKQLNQANQIALPGTVVGELMAGFEGGNRLERNLQTRANTKNGQLPLSVTSPQKTQY